MCLILSSEETKVTSEASMNGNGTDGRKNEQINRMKIRNLKERNKY